RTVRVYDIDLIPATVSPQSHGRTNVQRMAFFEIQIVHLRIDLLLQSAFGPRRHKARKLDFAAKCIGIIYRHALSPTGFKRVDDLKDSHKSVTISSSNKSKVN